MAKKPGNLAAMKSRAAKTGAAVAAPGGAAAAAEPKKPGVSPLEFLRQVRAEARKITWTSRKETWITTVMVFIMVVMASLFFLVVDWALSNTVSSVINWASGS